MAKSTKADKAVETIEQPIDSAAPEAVADKPATDPVDVIITTADDGTTKEAVIEKTEHGVPVTEVEEGVNAEVDAAMQPYKLAYPTNKKFYLTVDDLVFLQANVREAAEHAKTLAERKLACYITQ